MILHIYANFNCLGEFFGTPLMEKITPEEMSKDYGQIVSGLDSKLLIKLKECDLFYLGSFDNVSGIITPKKEFLLHCGEVVSRYISGEKKEVSA